MLRRYVRALASVASLLVVLTTTALAQLQPSQPASGPGGMAAAHAGVSVSSYGSNANAYTIFEPSGPTPASAPLVVFLHGWGGIDPAYYRNWIDHIVKRGNIVVYPAYQTLVTLPQAFENNAADAILAAIATLQAGGHVQPQLDKFALVGHSAGAFLSVNLAATAAQRGLPVPRVVHANQPGRTFNADQIHDPTGIPYQDYALVPPSALVVILMGDMDTTVGQSLGRYLWDHIPQVPAANKDLVRLATDAHGAPPLVGDHSAPQATPTNTDAFDFYGMWKLFDGLADAAFSSVDREYALGGGPAQRNMGAWSDGVPVQELRVLSAPDATPGVFAPATSTFFLDASPFAGAADVTFQFGAGGSGWTPLSGDWDGDGDATVGLYDPANGVFFLRNANSPGPADTVFGFGPPAAGWLPIVGDWDGDGDATVGLYAPATGSFFLKNTNSPGPADVQFGFGPGGQGWLPVAGDWDGDGDTTVGLYAPATGAFFLRNALGGGSADATFFFGPGAQGWLPIAGDWNQDGNDSVGVYAPTTGTFFLRDALAPGPADRMVSFGPGSLTPLAGNWELRCNCE